MTTAHLLSPGDPSQRTGGYLYNARLAEALRRRGWRVVVHTVPGAWPMPARQDHEAVLASVPDGPVLADGLLWTGARPRHLAERALVIVHSPLGVEGGADLQRAEVAALREARGVVSTGGPTQRDLADLGIASEQVPPGVGVRARRPTRRSDGRVHLVALCTITPRKRVDCLVDAVAAVPGCRLTVAGALDRDVRCVRAVQAKIEARGVADRVRLVGELDDDGVQALLGTADVLVHAARYEAWGMALSEAMARGVGVLSTPAGALEEGGGRVVPVEGLPDALADVVASPSLRAGLDEQSWARGRTLPTWDDVAARYGAWMEAV